jgi:PleD family two-component response regulator
LIKAADAALYDAKRSGRNRAKVSLVEAQQTAA